MAPLILRCIRRQRRRTAFSALGRRIVVVHTLLPYFGDWLVLPTQRHRRNFCE